MTVLGNNHTPTSGTFTQTSTTTEVAIQVTMPSNGVITDLNAYFRLASGSATAWLCLWNSSGTLLANVAVSAISSFEQWYNGTLATPYVASSGNVLYVGFAVPSANGFTVEYDASGTSYEGTQASPPGNATFGSSGFNQIGAYLDFYLGGYVNTGTSGSPTWTPGSIYVNTGTSGSPVWTPAAGVYVNTGTSGAPVWTPGA